MPKIKRQIVWVIQEYQFEVDEWWTVTSAGMFLSKASAKGMKERMDDDWELALTFRVKKCYLIEA